MSLRGFPIAFFVLILSSPSVPLLADTITVNSLLNDVADDGSCTLHEAITAANSDMASGAMNGECAGGSGDDTIEFAVAGTIQPDAALPNITTVIHIDGYSAPGAARNTLPISQGTNAVLTLELDGVNAGNVPGLLLSTPSASGSIVEGLVINNSANAQCCNTDAILVVGVNGGATTQIRGNFLSTDLTGTQSRPKGGRGIFIRDNVSNIVVGSPGGGPIDPGAVNLISGASSGGVVVSAGAPTIENVTVVGNLIGVNATGTASLENIGSGVLISRADGGTISDNILSGNRGQGIFFQDGSAFTIERNRVGTNASGAAAIPNGLGGVILLGNPNGVATIINLDINDNLVAFNESRPGRSSGIVVGANKSTDTVEGIRLARNLAFSNDGLEIDLAVPNETEDGVVYGVSPNDPDDPDSGPNRLQNYPMVVSAQASELDVVVDYALDSEPSMQFTLEFFHTMSCDDSGHGGAEAYLGEVMVGTDASGDFSGQLMLTLPQEGGFITAIATQSVNGTSEFSPCTPVTMEHIFDDGFEALVL